MAELGGSVYITYPYLRMRLQRREVGEVCDMRQAQHGHIQQALPFLPLQAGGQAVLLVQVQTQIGHHAQHRHAGERFQLSKPRLQQRHIPAKFVDDRAEHPLPLSRP